MKLLRRIILVLVIALVAVGAGGIYLMRTSDTVQEAVVNQIVNTTDVTEKLDSVLRDKSQHIAEMAGVDVEIVDSIIADLDIANWEAISLPSDAEEVSTNTFSEAGQEITIITYVDTSYVTLEYKGQRITFAVSESAKPYIGMVSLWGSL